MGYRRRAVSSRSPLWRPRPWPAWVRPGSGLGQAWVRPGSHRAGYGLPLGRAERGPGHRRGECRDEALPWGKRRPVARRRPTRHVRARADRRDPGRCGTHGSTSICCSHATPRSPKPTGGCVLATNPPVDITDGDLHDLERILGEAAHVLRIIGFAADGLTVIGELVPTLLLPIGRPGLVAPLRHRGRVLLPGGGGAVRWADVSARSGPRPPDAGRPPGGPRAGGGGAAHLKRHRAARRGPARRRWPDRLRLSRHRSRWLPSRQSRGPGGAANFPCKKSDLAAIIRSSAALCAGPERHRIPIYVSPNSAGPPVAVLGCGSGRPAVVFAVAQRRIRTSAIVARVVTTLPCLLCGYSATCVTLSALRVS